MTDMDGATVDSKPLTHADNIDSSVALDFRANLAKQNNTSTIDLVPKLIALSYCTHFECEIRSRRVDKSQRW